MNELKFLVLTLFYFTTIVFACRFFGKVGLHIFAVFSAIVMNICGCRIITLFGQPCSAGLILYAATYLTTNVLSENYGEEEAKKSTRYSLFVMVMWAVTSQSVLWFDPHANDLFRESFSKILTFSGRLFVAGTAAFATSQAFNIFVYHLIWKKTGSSQKLLWLRNNVGASVAQIVDTVVRITIAYVGVYSIKMLLALVLAEYVLKVGFTVLNTPFIYLARLLKNFNEKEENIESACSKGKATTV